MFKKKKNVIFIDKKHIKMRIKGREREREKYGLDK